MWIKIMVKGTERQQRRSLIDAKIDMVRNNLIGLRWKSTNRIEWIGSMRVYNKVKICKFQ